MTEFAKPEFKPHPLSNVLKCRPALINDGDGEFEGLELAFGDMEITDCAMSLQEIDVGGETRYVVRLATHQLTEFTPQLKIIKRLVFNSETAAISFLELWCEGLAGYNHNSTYFGGEIGLFRKG